MDENRITYFAETDARNKRVKFGIKAKDRTRHVYVIGKTGMGKSTLLENMAVQDIQNGEGMCFIDPHGKTADLLLEYVPKERVRDVIYIAPFDTEYPISFNVLESIDADKRHLVVSGLMSTFKKIWVDAWSARMEYILTNTLLGLLEAPGSTLLGVNRMLSDKAYRNDIVAQIKDPSVKSFWVKEFAGYTERMAAEAVPAIQNKVGQFTANPLIRNMIGQPQSSFDFRKAMDERKIIVINLSKGKIGDENMKLLGGLLVTKIYLAAMSRADIPDRVMKVMPNFYLYVDEFQNFANASFADILSEARKYKLNLTIAHQYIEQMDEIVRPAVFGNVGTMMVFRVGATDAEALENEFTPQFTIEDLVNLGFAQIYLKLMIDGLTSAPFSATTLPPIPHPDMSYVTDILAASREQFARARSEVEMGIIKFHEPTVKRPLSPAPLAPSPAASVSIVPAAAIKTTYSAPPTHQPFKAALGDALKAAPPRSPTAPVQPPVSRPATPSAQPPVQPPASPSLRPSIIQENAVPKEPSSASRPAAAPTASHSSRPASPDPVVPKPLVSAALSPAVSQPSVASSVPVKPVPLSALAPKPIPKQDPKVPSPKNVSDLKNALAAVLGKGKVSTPAAAQTPALAPVQASVSAQVPAPVQNAAPTIPSLKPIPPVSSAAANSAPVDVPAASGAAPKTAIPIPSEPPREVPEEVLKKVLKVD